MLMATVESIRILKSAAALADCYIIYIALHGVRLLPNHRVPGCKNSASKTLEKSTGITRHCPRWTL